MLFFCFFLLFFDNNNDINNNNVAISEFQMILYMCISGTFTSVSCLVLKWGNGLDCMMCVLSVSVRNNVLVHPWLRFCCVFGRTGQSWCKFRMDEVIHVVVILMFILRRTRHFVHSLRRPVCRLLTDPCAVYYCSW